MTYFAKIAAANPPTMSMTSGMNFIQDNSADLWKDHSLADQLRNVNKLIDAFLNMYAVDVHKNGSEGDKDKIFLYPEEMKFWIERGKKNLFSARNHILDAQKYSIGKEKGFKGQPQRTAVEVERARQDILEAYNCAREIDEDQFNDAGQKAICRLLTTFEVLPSVRP